MNNFNRWIRSKAGITTIMSMIVIVLVIAVFGQFAGWWGGPGTAGLPPLTEDSCMPTCSETDGRFLVLAGSDMASFAGETNIAWISVPQENASFTLSIFDGDSGQNNSGAKVWQEGNWDTTLSNVTYTLYADPLRDGSGTVVNSWSSAQMPNNAWYDLSIDNAQDAAGETGDYLYRFEATLDESQLQGASNFKLKSPNAYLSVGKSFDEGTSFGINAMLASMSDLYIMYPDLQDFANTGTPTYGGTWEFYFQIPDDGSTQQIEIWNGDADRGTSTAALAGDTDDPNTSGTPEWAGPASVEEREAGKGNPADDSLSKIYRREPTIQFVLIGPDGNEIARDSDVGGTEEWERFLVSTDPNANADQVVNDLPGGVYKLRIDGLDVHNFVWFHTDLELFSSPPPPPPPPPPCTAENSNLGGGYAIIALNPNKCTGQQNGLLFHGTSYTLLYGKAISNGCLRSVGTHTVESSGVEYVGEYDNKNSQVKIIPDPYQVSTPVSVDVAAPNCSDPAAHNVDGKKFFKGDVNLEPGLYCISGDVTINAGDVVKGDDVTLYFIDGKLTINGGSTVQLSAPYAPGVNVSPALSNILFYVPAQVDKKGNVSGKDVKITGNSDSYFTGVIYAPGSLVEFLGTSHTEGADATQVIGWDVRVGGTADLILGYTGNDLPVCTIP